MAILLLYDIHVFLKIILEHVYSNTPIMHYIMQHAIGVESCIIVINDDRF